MFMFNDMKVPLLKLGVVLLLGSSSIMADSNNQEEDQDDNDAATYTEIKKKIIDARCLDCHDSSDPKGNNDPKGKDFSTYDSLMDSGVITKGDPKESTFYTSVADGKMPKKGDKLTKDETQMIFDWIKRGAPNDEEV